MLCILHYNLCTVYVFFMIWLTSQGQRSVCIHILQHGRRSKWYWREMEMLLLPKNQLPEWLQYAPPFPRRAPGLFSRGSTVKMPQGSILNTEPAASRSSLGRGAEGHSPPYVQMCLQPRDQQLHNPNTQSKGSPVLAWSPPTPSLPGPPWQQDSPHTVQHSIHFIKKSGIFLLMLSLEISTREWITL